MDERQFKDKTKSLGLKAIDVVRTLPKSYEADVLGRQLLRAATSVGANYRAACRGKSRADVLNKLGTVEEEADESLYWLELLTDSKLVPQAAVRELVSGLNEVVAMTVASIRTLRFRASVVIQNPKSKI